MNIAEIENERLQIDNELDGFSEFVVIRSYQNIRIVHRDSKKWQGIIDDMDNVILPLVYDKIELDDNGIRLFLKDENDQFLIGLANIENLQVVLPARFKALYPVEDLKMTWCLDVMITGSFMMQEEICMKDSPKTAYHWIAPILYVFYGKIMWMIILWNAGIKKWKYLHVCFVLSHYMMNRLGESF